LLGFFILLDEWVFDVILTQSKEFAQLGTDNEQSARQHGASHLEKQEPGTWIGVSIGRPLKGDGQGSYLGNGKQDEQRAGEATHWQKPPGKKSARTNAKEWQARKCFTNF
jgi:hypothetical protein